METRVLPVNQVFIEKSQPVVLKAIRTGAPSRLLQLMAGSLVPFTENNYLDLLDRASRAVDDDSDEHLLVKTTRFVLDTNYKILLSLEGRPGKWTLRHSEMADRCISSGNLMFDQQNNLRMVSNIQTGFAPNPQSLQFLMIVLIKNKKIKLADEITFRQYFDETFVHHVKISSTNLIAQLSRFAFYNSYSVESLPNHSEPSTIAVTAPDPFLTPELPRRTLNSTSSSTTLLPNLSIFSSSIASSELVMNTFPASRMPYVSAAPAITTLPQRRRSVQLTVVVPPRPAVLASQVSALPAITVHSRQMPPQIPTFLRSVMIPVNTVTVPSSGIRRSAFHVPESKRSEQSNKRPKL